MKHVTQVLALAAVLSFALVSGCSGTDGDPKVAAEASDTGGSSKGDFGPPQGPDIKAVLTSPPMVPPATKRTAPTRVIVELDVVEKNMPISATAAKARSPATRR